MSISWRDKYKVHPAADAFPMMTDAELNNLAEDIKANGLQNPIVFWDGSGEQTIYDDGLFLLDGRNRLEAIERAGCSFEYWDKKTLLHVHDPVAAIIGLNIHRRHLTKEQQADLIVAAHKAAATVDLKPRQDGEVFTKGGRGKVNPVKEAAVAAAREHDISRRTVERALAKVSPRSTTPRPIKAKPSTKLKPCTTILSIEIKAARGKYLLKLFELPEKDRLAEIQKLFAAIEAMPKREGAQ